MSSRKKLALLLNEKLGKLKAAVEEKAAVGDFDGAFEVFDKYGIFFDGVAGTIEALDISDEDARPLQTTFTLLEAERAALEQRQLLNEDLAG